MSGIHTELVKPEHAYTRANVPWQLEAYKSRLIHYLSGGGMSTFGRTVGQERARRAHRRFVAVMTVLGIIYLSLFFI